MALSSAHFLIDQLPGPAAVLLEILSGLLLPTGGGSLAVSSCVSSLAGTLVVPPTPPCTVPGPLSPALVTFTPHTSSTTSSSSSSSNLLPSSPAFLLAPPGWSVPDERVLVAAGPAGVSLVAARQDAALPLAALQEVHLLLVDEHLEDAACTLDDHHGDQRRRDSPFRLVEFLRCQSPSAVSPTVGGTPPT